MKCLDTLILSALSATSVTAMAQAQTSDEKWVLFEDTYFDSGYTAFGAKRVSVLGESAVDAFVAGAWNVTDVIAVGVEADLLTSRPYLAVDGAETLTVFQVGTFAEFRAYSFEVADLFAGAGIGFGEAGYRLDAPSAATLADSESSPSYEKDSFTYIEPRLSGFFHVSHRLDVGAVLGYRLARGVELDGLAADDLNGLTTALSIRGNF